MRHREFIMDASYEIVDTSANDAKPERMRKDGSYLIWIAIIAVSVFLMVMGTWIFWYDTADADPPSDSHPEYILQPVQTCQIPDPAAEKRYMLYDIKLSKELQYYTQDVCQEYGVSCSLVIAVMKKESGFQPDVISNTNDYGIMQINARNHKWLEETLGIADWFDPKQNILAGVYMLSQFKEYEDVHQILMSYNCGPSGAKKLWSEGVYSTAYSRSVVEILNGLEVVSNE